MLAINLLIAAGIILLGILILAFVVKTAITLLKVAILIGIGVAAFVGLQYVLGA